MRISSGGQGEKKERLRLGVGKARRLSTSRKDGLLLQ